MEASSRGNGDADWDFFVSYTAVDRAWAEWIAWESEEAGYRVLVQAWDFVPGSNWISLMHSGTRAAQRTIAVLSPDYLSSVYATSEWQAAWVQDPEGRRGRVLPVRVADCERPGLLAGVVGVDLFGVPEDTARTRLLDALRGAISGRAKPGHRPPFPAGSPAAPDEALWSAAPSARPDFPDVVAGERIEGADQPPPAGAVRRLVDEALSEDDLDDLALDHFPMVYRDFSAGMTRRAKVRRLVEFADRQGRLKELADLTRASNPTVYARHTQQLQVP